VKEKDGNGQEWRKKCSKDKNENKDVGARRSLEEEEFEIDELNEKRATECPKKRSKNKHNQTEVSGDDWKMRKWSRNTLTYLL